MKHIPHTAQKSHNHMCFFMILYYVCFHECAVATLRVRSRDTESAQSLYYMRFESLALQPTLH